MCIAPTNLPNGQAIACRTCWQCRENRKNDLVGRNIAEARSSDASYAVTLTYEGERPETATLMYADFQRFMKRLRRNGYSVRYMVAGEYGSLKGRAHWHCILHFRGKLPDVTLNDRIHFREWSRQLESGEWVPQGFTYWQKPDVKELGYVLKYAQKDVAKGQLENRLAMSKKPPLGYDYFMQLALHYVQQGLSPQSPEYQFRDIVHPDTGRPRTYYLQGRMRELFLDRYLFLWAKLRDGPYPFSPFVEEYEDKLAREEHRADTSLLDAEILSRHRESVYIEPLPPAGDRLEVYAALHYKRYALLPDAGTVIGRLDDGTFVVDTRGPKKWHVPGEIALAVMLRGWGVKPPRWDRNAQVLSLGDRPRQP